MRYFAIAVRLLAGLAILAACSRGSGNQGASSGADTAAPSDQSGSGQATSDAPGIRMRVVLAGGPDAGTHESTPAGSTCIPYQSATLNGLGMAYASEDTAAKGISYLDFGTSQRVPTAVPIDSFGFQINIGHNDYEIRPGRGSGTGKATVTGRSPRFVASLSGKTKEGVGVDARLECLK